MFGLQCAVRGVGHVNRAHEDRWVPSQPTLRTIEKQRNNLGSPKNLSVKRLYFYFGKMLYTRCTTTKNVLYRTEQADKDWCPAQTALMRDLTLQLVYIDQTCPSPTIHLYQFNESQSYLTVHHHLKSKHLESNSLENKMIHLHMYAFHRCFYLKWLYAWFIQAIRFIVCLLRIHIKLTTFVLLMQSSSETPHSSFITVTFI